MEWSWATVLKVIIGVAAALVLGWIVLVITLAIARPRGNLLTESLRICPTCCG